MFTVEVVMAAALLAGPASSTEPVTPIPQRMPSGPASPALAEVLRPQILALGLAGEVLDPREKSFVMGQDPLGDLEMLRGRWQKDLDAPGLEESERFPDRKLVNEYLGANRAIRARLTERLAIDLIHAEEIRVAIADTDRLYQVWDAVRDSRCDYYYVSVRRESLRLLRDLVGPEGFYSGRLPPPVP